MQNFDLGQIKVPQTSQGVQEVELSIPDTNPSFTSITKGTDSNYILAVDKSKADPGSYTVVLAITVKYPNGVVTDRTVKLPIVIFSDNFLNDIKEKLINTNSSADANEASVTVSS